MKQTTFARFSLLPGSLWLLALFLVPFVVVVAVSFATTDILGQPIYGLHLEGYQAIFDAGFVAVFARSVVYAAVTTVVCLVLGYTAAYTIARHGGRYKTFLILLALVPWFVDYLIRIYSWIQIVGNGGVLTSLLHALGFSGNFDLIGQAPTVIGALVYNFLPYMLLSLYVSIEQLDGALIEAGQDLYGSPFVTLLKVTVPNTLPGVASGCLLVFLPAIGDFATAQLLGSPQQYMIGNIIANQVQTPGGLPIGAGLVVLLAVLLAVIGLVGTAIARPLRRRSVLHVG